MSSNDLFHAPIDEIHVHPVALREVDEESEKFNEIVASVKQFGILNAVNARRIIDPETGNEVISLLDGAHRFTAAKKAGLDTIPVQIVDIADEDVMLAQIVGNTQKVETKPAEYAAQIGRILADRQHLTSSDLAAKLGVSSAWIDKILKLNNIENEKIKSIIDSGDMTLANAVQLSKLPAEEQDQYVEAAMSDNAAKFAGTVADRIKEIREAKKQGKKTGPKEFRAVEHCRKMGEIKEEIATPSVAIQLTKKFNVTDPAEAFTLGLKWAFRVDPDSVEEQKAEHEKRKEEAAQKRAAAEAEKAAKRAEKLKAQQEEAKQDMANKKAIAAGETPPHPELIEKQKAAAEERRQKAAAKK